MPYIKQEDRKRIAFTDGDTHSDMDLDEINTAGEIQYAIALIIKGYIARNGMNYQNCNDVMGALTGANMEFYRRYVSEYEDKKIEENGDI